MNAFQGTERVIYEYIISNASELADISAKQVAANTHSNTTSVNRVCKKMGYASYTEMRYRLANDLAQKSTENSRTNDSKQAVVEFSHILQKNWPVYLYSRGASIVSVNYLSRFLSMANIPHLVITDIHQLTRANDGVLVVISKSGETQSVIDMAHNAKRKGLKVLSISHKSGTLSKVSNLNIDLDEQISGISLYSRESQIRILQIVDQVGEVILSN